MTPVGIDHTLDGSIRIEQSAFYRYSFLPSALQGPHGASVGRDAAFLDSPRDPRSHVGWADGGGTGYPLGWHSFEALVDTATKEVFHGVMLMPGAQKDCGLLNTFNLNCGSAPTATSPTLQSSVLIYRHAGTRPTRLRCAARTHQSEISEKLPPVLLAPVAARVKTAVAHRRSATADESLQLLAVRDRGTVG